MRMDPADIDALAFEALYTAGRAAVDAGDWRGALRTLAQAGELWQSDPFADVPSAYLRDRHADRLKARYLLVREKHAESAIRPNILLAPPPTCWRLNQRMIQSDHALLRQPYSGWPEI